MNRRTLRAPPPTPRQLERQRTIIGGLVKSALIAYGTYAVGLGVLVRPAIAALETASLLTILLVITALVSLYLVIGGALGVAFVNELRHWPPPGPKCSLEGGHFTRTWPWTAARILTQLITRNMGGRS